MTADLEKLVKPLVWEQTAENAWSGGSYSVHQRWPHSGGHFYASAYFSDIGAIGLGKHETLDEAQNACNAQNRRRIAAALDPDAVAQMVQEAVQAEREACAVVADTLETEWWGEYKNIMSPHAYDPQYQGMSDGAGEVAAAIRARGEA